MRSKPRLKPLTVPKWSKYIPHVPTPKQQAFLWLPHMEAFYGGAAGGGKSDALLMAALQYVDVKGYAALLLRKTYEDLKLPEALMDRADGWLRNTDAHWQANRHQWQFPSGATLTFGYLDTPRSQNRYQSAAFQFIGFDELTQFGEAQYRYLFSRLRKLQGANVPLRMRSAGNPGGIGHEWVKLRFVKPGNPERPYIPATLEDNPHLDQEEYRQALRLLTELERQWYEEGNWDARPGGAIAKREWFPVVDAVPCRIIKQHRFWDLAASGEKTKGDPDYTVGTLIGLGADKLYYVMDVVRGRWGPGDVERVMKHTAELDGRRVPIGIEQEGGASGKLFVHTMITAMAGYNVKPWPATGNKITRGMPFIRQAQNGNVRIVRGAWNLGWLDEITAVGGTDVPHDDRWDSAGGAFNGLAQSGWSRGPAA